MCKWWPWNQKNLDYEIETVVWRMNRSVHRTWNQKNLDYEIETKQFVSRAVYQSILEIKRTSITRLKLCEVFLVIGIALGLEIKRTSITRLKLWGHLRRVELLIPWNQKNLDYEIETMEEQYRRFFLSDGLEIKRTSITRLKLQSTMRTLTS